MTVNAYTLNRVSLCMLTTISPAGQAFSLSAQFARENFQKRGGNGASQRERGGGARRRTGRKGYYCYSPQSFTVIKSKMAATTTLRTRTRFRPPKIRLHCRLTMILSDACVFYESVSLLVLQSEWTVFYFDYKI